MALAVGPVVAGESGPRLTAAQGGNPLAQSNSKNGVAVFNVAGVLPGDPPATGVVTLKNTGDAGGAFAISMANVRDEGVRCPTRSTSGSTTSPLPRTPRTSTPGSSGAPARSRWARSTRGAERTYLLTASLPASAGNDLQGASARADFVWTETELESDGDVEGDSQEGGADQGARR